MLAPKRVATMLGLTAAAMTLTLMVSGTAFAGVDNTAWSRGADGVAANACDLQFASYGEHFYLDDNLKDGYGCYGYWGAGGKTGEIWNTGGAGTTVPDNAAIDEGVSVVLEVCAENNHSLLIDTCDSVEAVA